MESSGSTSAILHHSTPNASSTKEPGATPADEMCTSAAHSCAVASNPERGQHNCAIGCKQLCHQARPTSTKLPLAVLLVQSNTKVHKSVQWTVYAGSDPWSCPSHRLCTLVLPSADDCAPNGQQSCHWLQAIVSSGPPLKHAPPAQRCHWLCCWARADPIGIVKDVVRIRHGRGMEWVQNCTLVLSWCASSRNEKPPPTKPAKLHSCAATACAAVLPAKLALPYSQPQLTDVHSCAKTPVVCWARAKVLVHGQGDDDRTWLHCPKPSTWVRCRSSQCWAPPSRSPST